MLYNKKIPYWNNFVYSEYRAISSHDLFGNIGGFIGLLLGCSFFQVPDLILFLSTKIKNRYLKRKVLKANSMVGIIEPMNFNKNGPLKKGLEYKTEADIQLLKKELEQSSKELKVQEEKITNLINAAQKIECKINCLCNSTN